MHSNLTMKHHLHCVKTTEVTMVMCPFVCVLLCVFYVTVLPHHLLVSASAQCVFIMNWLITKTQGSHCAGLMVNYLQPIIISGVRQHIDCLKYKSVLVEVTSAAH